MIISHKHKYLFIEVPQTASTAISRELCENYDGMRILRKHATYYDFLKIASAEERRYFVFSSVRNPLDDVVSVYFKNKTNHKQRWTRPATLKKMTYRSKRRYRFVSTVDVDFPTYFMKYYKFPYNNLSLLAYRESDYIIRFEHIQEDFSKAIELIGIELKRPLPIVNKTNEKEKDFLSYYTPETIARAKRVFGPFMQQWKYAFPAEWGEATVSWWNQVEFELFNLFRHFYWRYLGFLT